MTTQILIHKNFEILGKAQALTKFFVEKQRAVEQNRTGSQNPTEKAPPVPYRFITPGSQGLEIDLRLCNREIISSAKPHLLHILNTAMQVRIKSLCTVSGERKYTYSSPLA